jgi:hypothetical protein
VPGTKVYVRIRIIAFYSVRGFFVIITSNVIIYCEQEIVIDFY